MKYDANSIKRYLSGVIADLDSGRKPERPRAWVRAFVVPAAIGVSVSVGAVSCLEPEPDGSITKDEVIEAMAEGTEAELCDELQAPADCDLCAELGWYDDGVCDDFCDDFDPDCEAVVEYGFPFEDICGDGVDNDGDHATDCCDSDCSDDELCAPMNCNLRYMAQLTETECGDCVDNDCDGLVDFDDPDCGAVAEYAAPFEVCGDGVDNDEDGAADCCDTDCADDELCAPMNCNLRYMAQLTETDCGDCIDNDCDGLTDESDGDCEAIFS